MTDREGTQDAASGVTEDATQDAVSGVTEDATQDATPAAAPAAMPAPEDRPGDWWRHPVERLLDLPRPTRATVHRRTVQALLAAYLLASVVCGSLVVTAAVNDWKISHDRGTATAEILSTGTKTLVRFQDDAGRYHTPGTGLKYPSGLSTGERVRVEYQRDDPDNVKVAGRGWTLALLPAVSSWLVSTLVAAVLFAGVRWWFRR